MADSGSASSASEGARTTNNPRPPDESFDPARMSTPGRKAILAEAKARADDPRPPDDTPARRIWWSINWKMWGHAWWRKTLGRIELPDGR